MNKRLGLIAITWLVIGWTHSAVAQKDEVVNISATVTGNQEQPKVLYIVPWKQAEDKTILYQQLNTRLEAVFGHVERREHIRQLELLNDLAVAEAPATEK